MFLGNNFGSYIYIYIYISRNHNKTTTITNKKSEHFSSIELTHYIC